MSTASDELDCLRQLNIIAIWVNYWDLFSLVPCSVVQHYEEVRSAQTLAPVVQACRDGCYDGSLYAGLS